MTDKRLCYNCKHLKSYHSSAGGGIYVCKKYSSAGPLGRWGYWTTKSDEPVQLKNCWEEDL